MDILVSQFWRYKVYGVLKFLDLEGGSQKATLVVLHRVICRKQPH